MRNFAGAALLLNLGVALACWGPAQWRYEKALEQASEPAAHGVHDERLADLMRDLDRLRDQRLPKAFDLREQEALQLRELAGVAQAMAKSATKISAAPPAGLDSPQLAAFRSLATTLEQQCAQLGEQAPNLDETQLRSRLAEIDSTCNQCHARFRIPGVVRDGD